MKKKSRAIVLLSPVLVGFYALIYVLMIINPESKLIILYIIINILVPDVFFPEIRIKIFKLATTGLFF